MTAGEAMALRAARATNAARWIPSPGEMARLVREWSRVTRDGVRLAGFNTAGLWTHTMLPDGRETTGLIPWDQVREDICRREDTTTTCQADAEADGERP